MEIPRGSLLVWYERQCIPLIPVRLDATWLCRLHWTAESNHLQDQAYRWSFLQCRTGICTLTLLMIMGLIIIIILQMFVCRILPCNVNTQLENVQRNIRPIESKRFVCMCDPPRYVNCVLSIHTVRIYTT